MQLPVRSRGVDPDHARNLPRGSVYIGDEPQGETQMEDPEHIQLSPQVTNIAEDLKSLFSSKGRISPGRAMWHSLILFLLAVLLGSTSGVLAQDKSSGYLIFGLAYFATIFLGLVAGVKRAHDLGRSGTEVLFLCVPLVNIIYGLKLTFQKGDTGPNARDAASEGRSDFSIPWLGGDDRAHGESLSCVA